MTVVVHHGHVEKMKTLKPSKKIYNKAITPWNGRGRRLVELTDGCYSGGDSQGLPGFIHPRVLENPTISFQ